ncbi:MAG: hypothetical protein V3U86_04335 [Acidobacteriota bacterium]
MMTLNLPLSGEAARRAKVRIDAGWIVLQVPLSNHVDTPLWRLLSLNAHLPGLSKIVLSSGWDEPVLLAEIPLDDESNVDERVEREFGDFEKAMAAVSSAGTGNSSFSESEASPSQFSPGGNCDLQVLCRDAGWSATPRDDGSMAVGLETRGEGIKYRARVAAHRQGGTRVSVSLADSHAFSRVSRNALGIFMLRASGSFRMVRASFKRSDPRWMLALEVCFPASVDPPGLNHALSALSVACEVCGPESAALTAKECASKYLRSRGIPSLQKHDVNAAHLSADVITARKSMEGDPHGSSGNSRNGNP